MEYRYIVNDIEMKIHDHSVSFRTPQSFVLFYLNTETDTETAEKTARAFSALDTERREMFCDLIGPLTRREGISNMNELLDFLTDGIMHWNRYRTSEGLGRDLFEMMFRRLVSEDSFDQIADAIGGFTDWARFAEYHRDYLTDRIDADDGSAVYALF